jgi:hypothetical protein
MANVERAFWPAKSAFLPTFFFCFLATTQAESPIDIEYKN